MQIFLQGQGGICRVHLTPELDYPHVHTTPEQDCTRWVKIHLHCPSYRGRTYILDNISASLVALCL